MEIEIHCVRYSTGIGNLQQSALSSSPAGIKLLGRTGTYHRHFISINQVLRIRDVLS
jgi:hypothetical protein